jgi:hypothetical protein
MSEAVGPRVSCTAFDRRTPGGIRGGIGKERLVVGERIGEPAVLLLGERQPEARLGTSGLEPGDLLIGEAGLLGNDAVGRQHAGLGEAGEPARRLAVETCGIGIGGSRLLETSELEIDGSDHIPAGRVLRVLAQARLDLGDELADARLLERDLAAAGDRMGRDAGRAVRKVEPEGEDREKHGDCERYRGEPQRGLHTGGTAAGTVPGAGLGLAGAGEQTAGDLDARSCGIRFLQKTTRALGLNLAELVAVDGQRARLGLRPGARRTPKGPQHGSQNGGSQECKGDPEKHPTSDIDHKTVNQGSRGCPQALQ